MRKANRDGGSGGGGGGDGGGSGGGGCGSELLKALQYHILNYNTKEATSAYFRQH